MTTTNCIFNYSKIWLSIFFCSLIVLALVSCADDSEPTPDPVIEEPTDPEEPTQPATPAPLDSTTFIVGISSVEDIADNGNASDVAIEFSLPNALDSIETFKVVVFEAASESQITINAIQNLNQNSFVEIQNTGKEYSITLPVTLKTFEGEDITEDQNYKVVVLSEGVFNNEEVRLLSGFSENFTLTSVTTSLQVTTLVSNLRANDGVSVDAEGNIYASNYGNNGSGREVLKITPSGEVSTFVDGLRAPLGNALDSEGNFYVAHKNDFTQGTITKIAPDGTRTDLATLSGYVAGIKLDADNNLYVSNYLDGRINMIAPDGTVSVFVSDPLLAGGVGMDFDEAGNLWVGNFITGDILRVTPEKEVSRVATVPTVRSQFVVGYITYLDGYVYATAISENKIYRISPDGTLEHFAGNGNSQSTDGDLLEAAIAGANGIASNKTNKILYITQSANNKFALRKIEL